MKWLSDAVRVAIWGAIVATPLALISVAAEKAECQGVIGRDKDKNSVQDFAPTSTEVLSFTKSATLDTTTIHAVRVQPSVAVTLKINGAGTGWPIAQNAVQEYRIPANVGSFVFSATSSAAASPNKVYYQPQ